MAEHDQVPGHAGVPLRVMVIIARVVEELVGQAIAEHNAEHHAPKVHDEPPVVQARKIGEMVRGIADDSAADARRAHEQQFHSGMPAKREDAPRAASDSLAEIGNSRMFVHEAADRYSSDAVRLHVANYHGVTTLANDGWALLEQVRIDAELRAQLRSALADSELRAQG